jgi:hypothetical protein
MTNYMQTCDLPGYHSPLCSRDRRIAHRHGVFDWGTPVLFEPLSDLTDLILCKQFAKQMKLVSTLLLVLIAAMLIS